MQGNFHRRTIVALTRIPFVLAFVVAVMACGTVHACPTCADGLAQNDPGHQSVAAGICYSVVFMMSMPYLILATFCSFAYLSIRRAQGRQALEGGDDQEV